MAAVVGRRPFGAAPLCMHSSDRQGRRARAMHSLACLPATQPTQAPTRACRYCTERWTSRNSVYALLTSSTSTAAALRRCATRLAALISWME